MISQTTLLNALNVGSANQEEECGGTCAAAESFHFVRTHVSLQRF